MAEESEQLIETTIAGSSNDDWWRGAVIYQIYPRSFQDSNGDGIGDLPGITSRLQYVADLGVDAIWLSPFFKSPMKDMGYDVSDYCDVDPVFGTLGDFRALVLQAHAVGLKVMIDQVLSHTSNQHPWFVESRRGSDTDKSDWYIWADARADGTPPTNWQSIFGGPAWTWDPTRRQYYFHNFLSSQPDLNFHNRAVQDALLDVLRFWLELGVDGFRLDTVNYYFHDAELRDNPPRSEHASNDVPDVNPYGFQEHVFDKTRPENLAFLERVRALLDTYPGTATVGEVGDGERSLRTMAEYSVGGKRLHMCYSFDLLSPEFSSDHIRTSIEAFEAASIEFSDGASWPCWAFSNHDVMRHISRWADNPDAQEKIAKLAASLLLSLKGSVCLYQGEELGLTEAELRFEDLTDPYGITFWPEYKGRDGCRTPMVWETDQANAGFSTADKTWLPVAADHVQKSVSAQIDQSASILAHYRVFLAFRKEHGVLSTGDIEFVSTPQPVLAFVRKSDEHSLFCAFNLSSEHVSLPVTIEGLELLPVQGFNAELNGDQIVLGGYQALFARTG